MLRLMLIYFKSAQALLYWHNASEH